jgi:hypothetical protein
MASTKTFTLVREDKLALTKTLVIWADVGVGSFLGKLASTSVIKVSAVLKTQAR